ncbi:MAG: hypothetical protein GWP91_15365 [Rhodobacterales bacterium]|nr:hypothetical protein [Rhodobacterales bacterium]
MRDASATYGQYDVVQESAPFPLDVLGDKRGGVRYVSERIDPDDITAEANALLAK